jgi:hypothetical protein
MPLDLRDREWPKPAYRMVEVEAEDESIPVLPQRERAEVDRYIDDVYVREGRVFCRTLGKKGVGLPIPPEECAIVSLVRGAKGLIYGATRGRRSHLFYYDVGPWGDAVVDIAVLGEQTSASVTVLPDGRIFIATRPLDPEAPESGRLFCYRPGRDRAALYNGYFTGELEEVCQPLDGEGISSIVADAATGLIYGLGARTAKVFSFDPEGGAVESICRVHAAGRAAPAMAIGPDGGLYGSVAFGGIFRVTLPGGPVEWLDAEAPCLRGRYIYNFVDAWASDPASGRLYGGTRGDGILFYIDTADGRVVTLGKPVAAPGLGCLAVARDGAVYGIAGPPDGMGHLFRYRPATGELVDLGIMLASSERFWHGYQFAAACVGRDGEIYFGECDRVSHLFIYFPPYP